MRLEVRSSPKALPAELAAEGSDSRVELLVGFERVRVYEGFPAVLAPEGSLARVQSFVCLEVPLLSEALPAVFARERLFSSVNPLVVIQVRFGEEPGTALQAHKPLLAAVCSLVRSEDALQREALATCGTGERPLVTVTRHVIPQVVWQAKRLLAELAFVRFLHLVDPPVDLEEASVGEALATLLASVRSFSTVELLLVSPQVTEEGEGFPTGSACVLISCIQLHFFSGVCGYIRSCADNVGYVQLDRCVFGV